MPVSSDEKSNKKRDMRGSSNERVVQYERRVHLRCMYFWVTLAFWRTWCIGCVQADGSWAELCFHGCSASRELVDGMAAIGSWRM